MGFPSVCYCVILPKPLVLAVELLDRVKLALALALFYLGLSAEEYAYPLSSSEFFPAAAAPSPVTPAAIKARLPAVKFSSLRRGGEPICAVCLGELQARQEVRELGNCSHVFHRGCIDKWVDLGQVTCPLCRAQLWPKERMLGDS